MDGCSTAAENVPAIVPASSRNRPPANINQVLDRGSDLRREDSARNSDGRNADRRLANRGFHLASYVTAWEDCRFGIVAVRIVQQIQLKQITVSTQQEKPPRSCDRNSSAEAKESGPSCRGAARDDGF